MTDRHPAADEIIAWALGDLETEARANVDAHLAECAQCRGSASALAAALHSYRDAPHSDAPPDILVDLLASQAHARSRVASLGSRRRLLPALAAAACLAAVFFTGFWAGRITEHPDVSGPRIEADAGLQHPLPEPPRLSFQATPPLEA